MDLHKTGGYIRRRIIIASDIVWEYDEYSKTKSTDFKQKILLLYLQTHQTMLIAFYSNIIDIFYDLFILSHIQNYYGTSL